MARAASAAPPTPTPTPLVEPPTPPKLKALYIALVNAAAFARICKLDDSETFQLRISSDKITPIPVAPNEMDGIPPEYHDFADVFSKTKADMLAEHQPYDLKIDLEEGAELPLSQIYSLLQEEQKALRDFINENVPMGFIHPSLSPYRAPVLFSRKKDGGLCLCINFCGLNKLTRKDRYSLPRISDLLESPKKARIYTKIDLRHAYHLVRICKGDEWMTTFRTRYGSFEWCVMPFGLTNAPVAFQRFMNDVFGDLLDINVFGDLLDINVLVYLDDILVYSDTPEQHREHVQEVLRRLRKHNLVACPSKCEWHRDSVEYLGYILSPDGLSMASNKVQTIQEWPVPHKVKDVQSFLGFANFY
jgi:hypothetical protein